MNIIEAIKSKKIFCNRYGTKAQYFEAKTGPHKDLVDVDYFVIYEDGESYFSTSLDLYPEDFFKNDYKLEE